MEDPLFIVQRCFSRGVFSNDAALFLYGMTDCAPFIPIMTFLRSNNATAVRAAGIVCRIFADDALDLASAASVPSMASWSGRTTSKGLCDLVCGQGTPAAQLVAPAMRDYVRSEDCGSMNLVAYARRLGVEPKIRKYLKVLL